MKRFTVALALGAGLLLLPVVAHAQLRTQVVAAGLTNPVAFVMDPLREVWPEAVARVAPAQAGARSGAGLRRSDER